MIVRRDPRGAVRRSPSACWSSSAPSSRSSAPPSPASVAVLVALVDQGPVTALLMLGGVILVQQIEGHVLQPFLMGRWVSVHPLGVIVAIAAGVLVAGIAGALVAVPFAAAVNAVVLHLAAHTAPGDDPEEELAEDYAAQGGADLPHDARRRRRGRRRGGRRRAPGDRRSTGLSGTCSVERLRPRRLRGAPRELRRHHHRDPGGADPLALRAWPAAPSSLKCENLQRTGSFKARGAYVRISRLLRGGAGPRRGGRLGRQPRPGRRAGGADARHPGPPSSCPRARRSPRSAPPAATAPRWSSRAATSRSRWSRPAASPTETGAVLIHPFDHRDIMLGQGTAGLEILEQVPDVAHRARAHRRRRAAGRHRAGGQGPRGPTCASSACRPPGAAAYPGLAGARASPVALTEMQHDGRRHRRRAAGRPHLRRGARPRRRGPHRLRELAVARPAGAGRAGQDGRRARRRGRRRGAARPAARASRPRRSRCSRAATSTRCCSAR